MVDILVDRLNTKDLLRRRHYNTQDDEFCVLCSLNRVEDLDDHLFCTCSFTRRCWQAIQIQWEEHLDLFQRIAHACATSMLPFFIDLVMIASGRSRELGTIRFLEGKIQVLIPGVLILFSSVICNSLGSKATLGPPSVIGLMPLADFCK